MNGITDLIHVSQVMLLLYHYHNSHIFGVITFIFNYYLNYIQNPVDTVGSCDACKATGIATPGGSSCG